MPFTKNRDDNERFKFYDNGNNEATVRVGGTGSVLSGLVFDSLTGEETTPTTETYRYYLGGTSGTLVATVVVTYSDNTKCFVTEVSRT